MSSSGVTDNRKIAEQASAPVHVAAKTALSVKAPRDGHAAQGVICFDDEARVIIVSSQAEKFASELFACVPRVGEVLPHPLSQCTRELRETRAAADGTPRRDFRKDGNCVSLSLAVDPQGNFHCLIFERKREVTDPQQLRALGLSPRETLVTFWILHQKTNWEIGKILQISTRTVDKHVERIFLKLQVNDRRDLMQRAREVSEM